MVLKPCKGSMGFEASLKVGGGEVVGLVLLFILSFCKSLSSDGSETLQKVWL